MALPRLEYGGELLLPAVKGYTFPQPFGVRVTTLPGGPSIAKADHLGGPTTVQVTYQLNTQTKIEFFQDFYHTSLLEGSLPFECLLALEGPIAIEHTAKIVQAPQYPIMTGFYAEVVCLLEATPSIDPVLSAARVAFYALYGDQAPIVLNQLAQFATIDSTFSLQRIQVARG